MTRTLKITVHQANHLPDVEMGGKNDPYAQVSLDLKAKTWPKTKTLKNAGTDPVWNQTLELPEYNPQEQPELYVEVIDQETGADEPIGFTTIPLNQVNSAHGHAIRGRFDLYTLDGQKKGEILLTIAIVAPDQTEAHHPETEIRGIVTLDSEHQHRVKGLKNKERATDAAIGALGAAALGFGLNALLGGKKSAATAEDAERED
ncbi:hypothetical protein BGZ97_012669 [Linnemannia gamsii]|jgi:hypothetical protein|uniref:C2 domain-containing protein n=1 Tax=Linnemannia gamsii TaxID=64522 RepID=A0A9P6RI36_9FUNG|nr:hypothetical protein BGZ97_012669 [Linnemannia gamsii]